MSTKKAPYRPDVVGSFLRSSAIKKAREQYEAGEITADALKQVEDVEIRDLVAKEKANGLYAVTDGEYRRAHWHLDFLSGLTGVEKVKAKHATVKFAGFAPRPVTLQITGPIDFPEDHPFLKHFAFLQSITEEGMAKQSVPGPSMLHQICRMRDPEYTPIERYQDDKVLLEDLIKTYRKAMMAFYDLGCRYFQLDDTSWGETFCFAEKRAQFEARGFDLDQIAKDYVYVINSILEDKPEDLTVTMHICRGNFRSQWLASGGYEPVGEVLFANCKVDGFFLEFDSDRAGGFEPLRYIKDQKVVLGLVTSKTPELEDKDAVIARIHEAAKYVPLEQLSISPQCGFASTEEGNMLTEEEQWAKIRLIREIADEVWGTA